MLQADHHPRACPALTGRRAAHRHITPSRTTASLSTLAPRLASSTSRPKWRAGLETEMQYSQFFVVQTDLLDLLQYSRSSAVPLLPGLGVAVL